MEMVSGSPWTPNFQLSTLNSASSTSAWVWYIMGMSHLFLVRHGQATFPYQDQDHLTGIGESQAHLLGSYWAAQGVEIDQVYVGPGGRHLETAALVGEVFQGPGRRWPEPVVLDSLDEYQAGALLNLGPAKLREVDDRVGELWLASQSSTDPGERERNWNRMFEIILHLWAHERVQLDGVEPWRDFCARVDNGISQIVADGGGGLVVVAFTSAGLIGVAAQRALQTSTERTLRLSWMVRNASLSEFLFSKDRFTLSTFNAFHHLPDPSVRTYR